ncbi:hypothetical protein PTKIN_Ptkin06aG0180100 [Pterospermum kingtungense]
MDARSSLLIFMSILGLLLSLSTHLIDATEAFSGPTSADLYYPSFDFPYKLEAVSRRRKSGKLRPPPPPTGNGFVHTVAPPAKRPIPRRPPPPPPPAPPPPPQPPMPT